MQVSPRNKLGVVGAVADRAATAKPTSQNEAL